MQYGPSILKLLSLPVLYGLLLYLGVASLNGLQFIEHVLFFLIPNKHRPDIKYLCQIPNRRIYVYAVFSLFKKNESRELSSQLCSFSLTSCFLILLFIGLFSANVSVSNLNYSILFILLLFLFITISNIWSIEVGMITEQLLTSLGLA